MLSFIFGIIAMMAARDLGTIGDNAPQIVYDGEIINQIFTIIYSYTFYFNFSILPLNQTAMHYNPEIVDGLLPIKYYLSFIPMTIVLGFLVTKKTIRKLALFAVLFYTFSILLVINLVPLGGTIVSERYAYFTVIASFILLALFVELIIPKNIILPFWLIVVVLFSITTFIKIDVWRNTYNLFENIYTVSPEAGHAINGFANEISKQGDYQRALELHNKILSKSISSKYFSDKASVYAQMDSTEQAIDYFNSAIKMSPDESTIYYKRAYVKKQSGAIEDAIQDLNISIRLDPMNYLARELRADMIFHIGDIGSACKDWSFLISKGNNKLEKYHDKYCVEIAEQTQAPHNKVEDEFGNIRLETLKDTLNGDSVTFLVQYYKDGIISEKGVLKNGKYNGMVFWYYPSGQLLRKGIYNDVFPYGKWFEFYEDGTLMAEYNHLSGVKHGTYKYYYEDGRLWTEKKYENGKLKDIVTILNTTGALLNKGSFTDGNGSLKIYDKNGTQIQLATYEEGTLVKFEQIKKE